MTAQSTRCLHPWPRRARGCSWPTALIVITAGTCLAAASPARAAGFAPADQTLFAPVVQLAPPGPARAARAVAIFDRQLAFQRKIVFHPELDAALQQVVDALPPRPSTVIRAAALYAKRSIPWSTQPDGTRQLCVAGGPRIADYLYELTSHCRSPETSDPSSGALRRVEHFSGRCTLQPPDGPTASVPASVVGTLGGELRIDTFDLGALVDVAAAVIAQCYGDLEPPWDTTPGVFNHHDRAVVDRMHRDLPHLAAKLDAYLQFHNVLDELQGPAGPVVLYNLDVEVRPDALRQYPRLAEFYRTAIPALTVQGVLLAVDGAHWLHIGLDHGHLQLTFMVRDGRLTPFNAALQPAGDGVALNAIDSGSYRTRTAMQVTSLGMHFGLANISLTTTYRRDSTAVVFESRMNSVPELVAPPGIHQAMDLVAGSFLRGLATGHGGLGVQLTSRRLPGGLFQFAGSASAELDYAPTLAFLARIGDAFANQHDAEVRAEERAFGEELFAAFVADYAAARAAILALDGGPGQ